METLKKLLSWMTSLPTSGKVLSTVIITLISVLLLFCACSCGTTKVVARVTDQAASTVTISTTMTPSVDVSPNVDFQFNKSLDHE